MKTTVELPKDVTRAIEIAKYIDEKVKFFDKKREKARKHENYEAYREKFWFYYKFQSRAFHLIMDLRSHKRFGDSRFRFLNLTIDQYKKREAERIAKGREIFQSKHKYSLHFFQSGLHQDYGMFKCDKCCGVFYHSPSTITKANKVVYAYTCGHCTNEIIGEDWGSKPYW